MQNNELTAKTPSAPRQNPLVTWRPLRLGGSNNVYRHAAIILFYALLAVLALHRPLFNMATHVAGNPPTDWFHFHWNYWWIRHALTTPGLHIYETNYVMAPFTSNLALHTLTPIWFPLWALIEPLFGTVVAVSAILVLAYTLCGYTFFLLLRREGVSIGLALVGGVMLEFAPMLLTAAYWTNLNLLGWFWFPTLMLLWGKLIHSRRRWLWTLVTGCAVWLMLLTDIQYALFGLLLVVPYILYTIWRTGDVQTRVSLLGWGALAAGIALVLLWFIGPLRYLMNYDRGALVTTPAEQAVRVKFPQGYFWHYDEGKFEVSFGAVIIPLTLLAMILNWCYRFPAATRRISRWFWLALTPVPLILAAGSYATIGGRHIDLPYLALHNLLGGNFRYPQRFTVMFLLPAALFVLLTLTFYLRRRSRLRLWLPIILLLVVIADSRAFESLPIQPFPPQYDFYRVMGQEPYDYIVLEVPTAAASGEGIVGDARAIETQFYGMTHGKRMVNGHIARVDISHYWYTRTDDAMLSWLGQRRYLEPELVEQQIRERIFEWPIGYIVIHTQWIERDGPTLQEIVGYFNSLGDLLCPMWVEGDALVYRTAWHPDGCPPRTPPQDAAGIYAIDIGAPDDMRYIGWGWHRHENIFDLTMRWAGEYPQAQLYVDLPPGDYDVEMTMQAFTEPRTVTLLANGQSLGDAVQVSPDGLGLFTFALPEAVIGDGQHINLTLDYDGWLIPAEIGMGSDERRLAVMVDSVRFVPVGAS